MKKFKSLILLISIAFTTSNIFSQANPSASILPLNPGGVVAVGATMDVKVTILNTLAGNIVASKLRPVVTIPAIATILPDAQQTGLPPGWVIVSNAAGQIRVCNASDVIGGNEQRDIIIKVQGTTIGGPIQCAVNLFYGGATCAVSGAQPSGNIGVDDFATSSITVIAATVPVTLRDFNAVLINCQPVLNWITETEINSDRFEIERGNNNNFNWITIGIVTANGNTTAKYTYNFIDKNINASAEKLLYRLKMIDKDGTHKYSNVLPVFINCKTISVHVYPNPVQDGMLYVSITGTKGNSEATLLSLSGQVIIKKNMNNGTNYLNTLNIADGVYILKIKDANGLNKDVKVFIQN